MLKRVSILSVCALSIFAAGCTADKEGGAETGKATRLVKPSVGVFTADQWEAVEELCDESDDAEINLKTTFEDGHCYHV